MTVQGHRQLQKYATQVVVSRERCKKKDVVLQIIDREFVTSAKNSRILTNYPKLKKFVKIRTKIRLMPECRAEFDAFHGFILIKI